MVGMRFTLQCAAMDAEDFEFSMQLAMENQCMFNLTIKGNLVNIFSRMIPHFWSKHIYR